MFMTIAGIGSQAFAFNESYIGIIIFVFYVAFAFIFQKKLIAPQCLSFVGFK